MVKSQNELKTNQKLRQEVISKKLFNSRDKLKVMGNRYFINYKVKMVEKSRKTTLTQE